ncbi:YybH family protein [Singulisphaera sp. PoT]|uniref:YybH family protein n=1 Tax=Singulisphaera sp. PoT TaxID=3411797 RepID=UPI003BF5B743
MSKRWFIPAALVGLLALGSLRPGFGETDKAKAEANAIRELLDTQVEDWNGKDLDGFLKGYWDDPKVVFQSGPNRFEGFEALRSRYQRTYQAEGREMGKLAFKEVDVVILGPDAALARGRWQLTMSDDKKPAGLFTLILRKLPEGWRIVHDHTSS